MLFKQFPQFWRAFTVLLFIHYFGVRQCNWQPLSIYLFQLLTPLREIWAELKKKKNMLWRSKLCLNPYNSSYGDISNQGAVQLGLLKRSVNNPKIKGLTPLLAGN